MLPCVFESCHGGSNTPGDLTTTTPETRLEDQRSQYSVKRVNGVAATTMVVEVRRIVVKLL